MKRAALQDRSRPPSRRNSDRDRSVDRDAGPSIDPPPPKSNRGGARPGAGRPVGAAAIQARQYLDEIPSWRIPKGIDPAVQRLGIFALGVVADIAKGYCRSQTASTRLKAAIRLRDEVCGILVAPLAIKSEVSLVNILTAAAARINEKDPGAIKSLPPASPEELSALASQIGFTGPVEHVAAVLAKDATEDGETEEVKDGEVDDDDGNSYKFHKNPFARELVPPFAPGSRVRDGEPLPTRGRFVTTDDED